MLHTEWPAESYAIGSYIQTTIAKKYLPEFCPKPTDTVLDIGCGNGAFTKNILDKVPAGTVLGIDSSQNMLQLAQNITQEYPNFSVAQGDVLTMTFKEEFDQVVSFWCLQWSRDIQLAFSNIVRSLKKGGKFFTLFPTGDDPFMMAYYALKESKQFPELNNFIPPVNYGRFTNLDAQLESIPDKKCKILRKPASVKLPNIDTYRKFVNGIAFYQGQIAEDKIKILNEAMVSWYQQQCEEKFAGEILFNLSIYLVMGEKC